jgi:putative ABC transport system permease protein
MAQHIPLAWKQLSFERMKLGTALAGVMVAVTLMWVQLGILASLYKSATVIHRNVNADLIVLHRLSDSLSQAKPFSVRTLYRSRANDAVEDIGVLLMGPVTWRNPDDGSQWQIQCYGYEAEENWLKIAGAEEEIPALRWPDTFLYDRKSRAVFGKHILTTFDGGGVVEIELNHRRTRMVGTTELAASFGQMGNIITNRANFLRLHPGHSPDEVHVGLIRLKKGSDLQFAKKQLSEFLAPEVIVLTAEEFTEFELRYWKTNAPVGFIFTMGTAIGFFIGFIVVYQILYTDVTNHLPHYATMKAIGFTDGYLFRLVVREGVILSVVGFIPGSLLAMALYKAINHATGIPIEATWERAVLLLGLTILMCLLSGLMATRRLRAADPADVF